MPKLVVNFFIALAPVLTSTSDFKILGIVLIFYNEPELGASIYPGMALTPLP